MRFAASWSPTKSVPRAAACLLLFAAGSLSLRAQTEDGQSEHESKGDMRAALAGQLRPAAAAVPSAELHAAELPDDPGTLLAAASVPTAPDTSLPPAETTLNDDTPPCRAGAARQQTMTHDQLKAEESQFIAGVVPNFNTVFGVCSPPLKPVQKMDLVYHAIFVPFTVGLDALLAGADEVDGSHNGYGWGPGGYFKRFGAEFADSADAEFIGNGILPIVLRQDPRYFQLGAGHPVFKRIVHAALSDFICLGDNGRRQFNTSNVVGNFIAGTISNAYYPANERGVRLTITNAIKVTLEGSLGSQLLEFSPELSAFAQRVSHRAPKPEDPIPPR